MLARCRPIPTPRCGCGATATHEVFNTSGSMIGKLCEVHAIDRVRELNNLLCRTCDGRGKLPAWGSRGETFEETCTACNGTGRAGGGPS